MTEIRNIIFDFGGVIVNLDDHALRRGFHSLGIRWWTQLMHRHEIGQIIRRHIDGFVPTDELYAAVRRFSRKTLTDEQIHDVIICLTGDIIAERMQLIRHLKEKYRVILLSNISDLIWTDAMEKLERAGFPAEECFTDIFVSYKMGVAKPDAAIYEQVIRETGILPEETLYFDDRVENYEAGLRAGFHAVLVPRNHIEDTPQYQVLIPQCR